jgi:peptidyl-prolyl cis-trans isomerase A (cyclophilin A)
VKLPTFLHLLLAAALLQLPATAVPPTTPYLTAATWNASNSITLTWQDRSTDETGFTIAYRRPDTGEGFSIYGTVNANITTVPFTPTPATQFRVCGTVWEWVVVAHKGDPPFREYSQVLSSQASPTNARELLPPPPTGTAQCPPVIRSVAYTSGMVNTPFAFQASAVKRNATNGALIPVTGTYSATEFPAGFNITPAGLITANPVAVDHHTFTLRVQEAGGPLAAQTMKVSFFRPVPGLVEPVNDTPLVNRTLRRNAAATLVDLGAHFNDPDVTDASRLVFNMGTIDFLYYPETAPATVANFKGYISRGDFVNTFIHRSIPGFVLQGGGYKAETGTPSITRQPPVVNEPEISNTRGTVAMAKSGGDPNSATSEFFISLADNAANLNNQNEGFTVFARVPAAGMGVADIIAALPIRSYSSLLSDCPVTNPPPAAFSPDSLVKLLSAGPVAPLSYSVESSAPAVCGVSMNAAQLTLTPLATGTADITVTTTDLDNQSINRTFNVTVEEHLTDWLAAHNFPVAGDAAALANPDGDSAPNIMEFGLMTDPQSPASAPAPLAGQTASGGNQYLTLTFPVRKLTGSGFLYTVESQNGLTGAWMPVWTSANGLAHAQVVSFTDQPDRTNVTIRDTAAIAPGTERFVRLRVTDTP